MLFRILRFCTARQGEKRPLKKAGKVTLKIKHSLYAVFVYDFSRELLSRSFVYFFVKHHHRTEPSDRKL